MQEEQNQQPAPDLNQAQPGQVVAPGGATPSASTPVVQQAPQPQPVSQQPIAPVPQPQVVQQQPVAVAPEQVEQPETQPPYGMEASESPQPIADTSYSVSWTASEYIAHDKDFVWYASLGLITVLLAGLLYFITRDFVSSFVALFGAFVLGFYGARKPRQLTYELDAQGLTIGEKHYNYLDFKKFSLVPEGAFSSIRFVPHKRFGPPLTIYYGPAEEDKIVTVLSGHLPIEEHKIDATDRLMRRIRF